MTEQAQAIQTPEGFSVDFVKQFMVFERGKWFITYPGLLHLAHQKGLVGIETNILQFPNEQNGQTTIVRADVRLELASKVRTFTGLGDANPGNLARPMIPHAIRMAETRAKSRALRDAVDVGVAALEELADDAEEAKSRQAQQPVRPAQPQPQPSQPAQPNGHAPTAAVPPQADASPPTLTQGPDNAWTLRIDGQDWRVPDEFKDLSAASLDAYRVWVRKSQFARNVGELKAAWEGTVQPSSAKFPDYVKSQIGRVFTQRRKALEGGTTSGKQAA